VVLWMIIRTAVPSTTSATFAAYFSCISLHLLHTSLHTFSRLLHALHQMETPHKVLNCCIYDLVAIWLVQPDNEYCGKDLCAAVVIWMYSLSLSFKYGADPVRNIALLSQY